MENKQILSFFYSYARADNLNFQLFLSGFRGYIKTLEHLELEDWYDAEASGLWREEIATQIDYRKVMIVLLTPISVTREEVKNEVITALNQNKQIIPIAIDDAVEIPEYLKNHQVIRASDYARNLDGFFAEIVAHALNRDQDIERSKHNLYVVSLSKHSGRTSVIVALGQLLVDGYHFPGYFKPFQVSSDNREDIKFIQDKFKLKELNMSLEVIAPFEYSDDVPDCSETTLKTAFEKVTKKRRLVMIEGIRYPPLGVSLRQMVTEIFDARLLVVIDHLDLDRLPEPPKLTLQRLIDDFKGIPTGFLFNKVPTEELSPTAEKVRQFVLSKGWKEIGQIPFDVKLTGISIRDVTEKINGHLLVGETPELLNELIWEPGQTAFDDQHVVEFYQQRKENLGTQGVAIFIGMDRLLVNMKLARLGYHLFLTGVNDPNSVEPALIDAVTQHKKALVCFKEPTQVVLNKIEDLRRRDNPFCHEGKMKYLEEITQNLDKEMFNLIVKRSNSNS